MVESYIDFIKKFNSNKSISSSTDSEFDNFLKGGANNIKGGFPPVYSIDTESDTYRAYSPKLNISEVLSKKDKVPFLNVKDGGFLNIFQSETSIDLPNDIEIISNIKNNSAVLQENISTESILENSSVVLPENLELESIKDEFKNIQDGGSNKVIDNLFLKQFNLNNKTDDLISSVMMPNNIEIISLANDDDDDDKDEDDEDDEDDEFGIDDDDDDKFDIKFSDNLDTTIDLPENIQIISNNQDGGDNYLDADTTIDLPDDIEIITIKDNAQSTNLDMNAVDTTVDLPDVIEILTDTNDLIGGEPNDLSELDTTVELPDNIEIVNINNFQNGGESNDDLSELDTTVELPDNIEIVNINNFQNGNDTDTSFIDILDKIEIFSVEPKSNSVINNIFLKNVANLN